MNHFFDLPLLENSSLWWKCAITMCNVCTPLWIDWTGLLYLYRPSSSVDDVCYQQCVLSFSCTVYTPFKKAQHSRSNNSPEMLKDLKKTFTFIWVKKSLKIILFPFSCVPFLPCWPALTPTHPSNPPRQELGDQRCGGDYMTLSPVYTISSTHGFSKP